MYIVQLVILNTNVQLAKYFGHDWLLQDALCKLLFLDEHICITKHITPSLSTADEDFAVEMNISRYGWDYETFTNDNLQEIRDYCHSC